MRYILLAAVLLAAAGAAVAAPGAKPDADSAAAEKAFHDLYADAIARAKATIEFHDDLDLARRLIEAARQAGSQPRFVELACSAVWELGQKVADGYPLSLEALDVWEERVPDAAEDLLEKRFAIVQLQYVAARGGDKNRGGQALLEVMLDVIDLKIRAAEFDAANTLCARGVSIAGSLRSNLLPELKRRAIELRSRRELMQKIAGLKARVRADPDDTQAREMVVRLLVAEFDNPKEAAKFASDALGDTAKFVLVAAMNVDRLPEPALVQLADWYRGMAADASPRGKVVCWRRALEYYAAYLEKHTAEDADRTKAAVAVKEAEWALEQAEIAAAPPPSLASKAEPSLSVVTISTFTRSFASRFPPEKNLAKGGAATSTGGSYESDASDVLAGSRTGASWSGGYGSSTLTVTWAKPVTARYVVLFGSFAGSGRSYGYGMGSGAGTYVTVNEAAAMRLRTMGLPGPRVAIVDMGGIVDVRSIKLDFSGWSGPYVSGVEVHY